MKAFKVLAVAVVALGLFVGGTLLFLFSSSGNELIKGYLQKELDAQLPIKASISDFLLKWSEFKLVVMLDDGSKIDVFGRYELLSQSVDSEFDISIKELANFEKLIEQRINGPLALKGKAVGSASSMSVSGVSDLFKSETAFDISLEDSVPKKVVLHMKNGSLASALKTLNQPVYASGIINIKSDILPQDGKLKGGANINLTQALLDSKVFKKELDFDLPDSGKLELNANLKVDGDDLNIEAILNSAIAKLNISNTKVNIKTFEVTSTANLVILSLEGSSFEVRKPINMIIKADGSKKLMVINATSDIFGSATQMKTELAEFKPKGLEVASKNIDVKSALIFAKQSAYADGKANIEAKISDLKNLSGVAKVSATSLILNSELFKSEGDAKLPPNTTLDLVSNIEMDSGIVEAVSDIKSALLDIKAKKSEYNTKDGSFKSDYDLNIPELSRLESLIGKKLLGELKAQGEIQKSDKMSATFTSKSFGGELNAKYFGNSVEIDGKGVSAVKLTSMLNQPKFLNDGLFDISANMSFDDKAPKIEPTLNGVFDLSGKSVVLNSYDIDRLLEQYKNTNRIDLFDVGAVVLAGPLGLLGTKAFDVGGAINAKAMGGTTLIKDLKAKWNIKNGVATAEDVAFSTNKNRLAMKGAINLGNERFQGFSIGVLNAKGCATIKQNVEGTTSRPNVNTPESVVQTVTNILGSFLEPVKKVTNIDNCGVYYSGSVAHPR